MNMAYDSLHQVVLATYLAGQGHEKSERRTRRTRRGFAVRWFRDLRRGLRYGSWMKSSTS